MKAVKKKSIKSARKLSSEKNGSVISSPIVVPTVSSHNHWFFLFVISVLFLIIVSQCGYILKLRMKLQVSPYAQELPSEY